MAELIRPKANWKERPSPIFRTRCFTWGEISVLKGFEDGHWHISISHPRRYPTWEEIKAARYDLLPHDITMAMILPPPTEYVNVHQNCFHLWQIPGNIVLT